MNGFDSSRRLLSPGRRATVLPRLDRVRALYGRVATALCCCLPASTQVAVALGVENRQPHAARQILLEARAAVGSIEDHDLKEFGLLVVAVWEAYAGDGPAALDSAAISEPLFPAMP